MVAERGRETDRHVGEDGDAGELRRESGVRNKENLRRHPAAHGREPCPAGEQKTDFHSEGCTASGWRRCGGQTGGPESRGRTIGNVDERGLR